MEIRCKTVLGKDLTMDNLCAAHHAVLLSHGAWGATSMRVEKEDSPGVLTGLKMLRDVAEGSLNKLNGRVIVVGGGNTAIDASRTSVRIGADETVLLYRRTEAEMPAHHEEVEAARKEGVAFTFLVAPRRVVVNEEGRVSGLECIRMEQGPPDSSGRRKPVPIEGSEYIEKADWIIAAIGQYPDLVCLKTGGRDITCLAGCVVVNRESMETSVPGVYAAGDVVTGPATVIEGIAGGRRAACSIHRALSGSEGSKKYEEFVISKETFAPLTSKDLSCHTCSERACMPERPASERVKDFREVELGLSRSDTEKEAERCLSCGCIEVNDCALRRYAGEYSIDIGRYLGEVNKYTIDNRHPMILIDPNKCIKCGRCIKTCQKILDAPALGFINRGFSSIISPAMRKPLMETTCVSCGNCIDSCPTGALTENQPLLARLGDRIRVTPSVCSFCPVGCRISIKAFGRDMRIRSLRDAVTGKGDYLCRKGRFGSRYLMEEGRLEQPSIRRNGRARYTDWHSALEHTAHRLNRTLEEFGPDSIGVIVSERLTNEESYAAVKFSRTALKTSITGSTASLLHGSRHHEIDAILGVTASTVKVNAIDHGDILLLVNCDPIESHQPLGWKIKEARRAGKKIIIINSNRTGLTTAASQWLQPRRGTLSHLLGALMDEILTHNLHESDYINRETTHIEELKKFLNRGNPREMLTLTGLSREELHETARLLTDGRPSVIAVYDMDNPYDRSHNDLAALTQLLLLTGNMGKENAGLMLLHDACNSTGSCDMGAEAGYLPGRVPLFDNEGRSRIEKAWGLPVHSGSATPCRNLKELLAGEKIKALVILGENPCADLSLAKYIREVPFIAACDLFPSETTEAADVVLPASSHVESGGSFTGLDGSVQHFLPACSAPGEKTTLEIIGSLARHMGSDLPVKEYQDTFEEIGRVIPGYGKREAVPGTRFRTHDGKAHFAPCILDPAVFPVSCRIFDTVAQRYMNSIEKKLVNARG